MSSSLEDPIDMYEDIASAVKDIKKCGICCKEKASYACPRCNRPYCSLKCYQGEAHADCSEAFYRECVVEELTARSQSGDPESCRRVQEALVNIYQQSAEDDLPEELDSDDESDEEDLADRLRGIDLNCADAVWAQLSKAEQTEFKKLIQSGEVEEIVPDWEPWWLTKPVQELDNGSTLSEIPKVINDVPAFSNLCKGKPAGCFPFNVANTVAGYVYCCRHFQGDLLSEPLEAVSVICSVAGSLRKKENYSTFSHAIAAAAAEVLAKDDTLVDVMSLLKSDVEAITTKPLFLHAALSDIHVLLHSSLKYVRKPKPQNSGAFTRQFSSGTSTSVIPSSELKALIKKLEFYISWVREFS